MLIQGRPYRRAADVVSPQESSEEGSSSESEGQWPGILFPKSPLKRYRRERGIFSEEEDIPLAKLVGRLKVRKRRLEADKRRLTHMQPLMTRRQWSPIRNL